MFNFGETKSSQLFMVLVLLLVIGAVGFFLLKKDKKKPNPNPATPPPSTDTNKFVAIVGDETTRTSSLVVLPSLSAPVSSGVKISSPSAGQPTCITQLNDKSGFIVCTYEGGSAVTSHIYKISDINNPTWVDLNIPYLEGWIITSIKQRKDESDRFLMVMTNPTQIRSTVYETGNKELGSSISPVKVFTDQSNRAIALIQLKDDGSFFYIDTTGILYNTTNTDLSWDNANNWNIISTTLNNNPLPLIHIYQLVDTSFIAVDLANQNIYSTDEITNGTSSWVLENNTGKFVDISEILT
jgi:hypothetical protein